MLVRRALAAVRMAWSPGARAAMPASQWRGSVRAAHSDSRDPTKPDVDVAPAGKDGFAHDLDPEADDILSEENTRNLPGIEVARLRMIYEYIKEHTDAVEHGAPTPDPEANPLIDPRSFDARALPKVPAAALRQFREDLPPESARDARALPTRAVWDGSASSETAAKSEALSDLVGDGETEQRWAKVDERTMDPFYLLRMRRQRMLTRAPAPSGAQAYGRGVPVPRRAKRRCRLSDAAGRVALDFRQVGVLSAFLNEHGKIVHRRRTALSAKAQRKVNRAVKTARQMALVHPEPKPGLSVAEMLAIDAELQAAAAAAH